MFDTIAAIATPPGIGGVGIIRVSGPDVMSIRGQLFPARKVWEPRYVYCDRVVEPDTGVVLDEGCVVYFEAPQSYTGEDVLELQLHASPQVMQSVLSVLLALDVRLADPGEFTKRAVVNGKMDLTQAESVIELIHSKSMYAQRVSLAHLRGSLFKRISLLRAGLMRYMEQIEGSIDFPDEVDSVDRVGMIASIEKSVSDLSHLLRAQDFGKWIQGGVQCVIVGRPNVGKSSLLNALLGESRSIVTSIPGTTRDFIDAQVLLGGVTFSFVDTAGVRSETTDVIELLGMRRIRALIRSSDVVLWVVDGSVPLQPDDYRILEQIKRKTRLYVIVNKSDKRQRVDLSGLEFKKNTRMIAMSTKKQHGLGELKEALRHDFVERLERLDVSLMCNVRQVAALRLVRDQLKHLLAQYALGAVDDALSIDLKGAILKLGEVTGDDVTEEVLDGIFSRFCVGK